MPAGGFTRTYYAVLGLQGFVSLAWLVVLCWLARLDEQAFLRQPRLSLTRRIGISWAPSYRLKLALWHLVHGRPYQAAMANPLVYVVSYLGWRLCLDTAVRWRACRG